MRWDLKDDWEIWENYYNHNKQNEASLRIKGKNCLCLASGMTEVGVVGLTPEPETKQCLQLFHCEYFHQQGLIGLLIPMKLGFDLIYCLHCDDSPNFFFFFCLKHTSSLL